MHYSAQLLEHISASSCRVDWGASYIRYVVTHTDFQHILAIGGFREGRPTWHTTLIYHKRFLTKQAISNHTKHLPVSLTGLVFGGRNSVLILSESNPKTDAELDKLFNTPKSYSRAAAYVECICITPLELCKNCALEHWQTLQAEQCRTPGTAMPRRPEPSPMAPVNIWKHWLKESCKHPQSRGS
jgi:hypothetical protein